MSWDIFVQDIPADAASTEEIPDDFQPKAIGLRQEIIARILEVAPHADFSDPAWGHIDSPAYSIEVNIGDDRDPICSFTFHVRGDGAGIIADILRHLDLRAFDPGTPSGIFDPATAAESLKRWRNYCDQILVP